MLRPSGTCWERFCYQLCRSHALRAHGLAGGFAVGCADSRHVEDSERRQYPWGTGQTGRKAGANAALAPILFDRLGAGSLKVPWVLDIDVTVKPLYGKQEGAVVGYNPTKPGPQSCVS